MNSPILQHDLIVLSLILRSSKAPEEKRYFRNDDDKVVPFTVRPKYCLTKKEAKAKLHALFNRVMAAIPSDDVKLFKKEAEQFSSNVEMYRLFILQEAFTKYVPKETLKEFLPNFR